MDAKLLDELTQHLRSATLDFIAAKKLQATVGATNRDILGPRAEMHNGFDIELTLPVDEDAMPWLEGQKTYKSNLQILAEVIYD